MINVSTTKSGYKYSYVMLIIFFGQFNQWKKTEQVLLLWVRVDIDLMGTKGWLHTRLELQNSSVMPRTPTFGWWSNLSAHSRRFNWVCQRLYQGNATEFYSKPPNKWVVRMQILPNPSSTGLYVAQGQFVKRSTASLKSRISFS